MIRSWRQLWSPIMFALVGGGLATIALGMSISSRMARQPLRDVSTEISSQSRGANAFRPTDAQWVTLATAPAIRKAFQLELVTEGKVAINEDRATPVFSPYSGRVMALRARPGDIVEAGQPLFVVEATDTVQGLNDLTAALGTRNSARSKLNLAQIAEKRANDLYAGKAVPLKDWQQAQADLATAENDFRSSESAVQAFRSRLKLLGHSDQVIATFEQTRQIRADTPISAPIGGVVVQRKVGPGQYLNGAGDPVFLIGDLSTIWLTAFVRETDMPHVKIGQSIAFRVPAAPAREYRASIDHVASALDPASRRLQVRATVANGDGGLKPEMFANVTLYVDNAANAASIGIPRDAVIYEGESARVWVARGDHSVELRRVKLGLISADAIEIVSGLAAGENVVTRGALFVDRLASGS